MWVRTQDKLGLFELKGVKIREHSFENNTKEYIILGNDNLYNHLGTYKSKERALEVLDEIQSRISPGFNYKGNNEEADLFIKMQILNSMIAVYQMPKE